MAWIWLALAGLFEVGWSVGLKHTDGFTRPVPSVLAAVAIAGSMLLLAIAARTIPMGTAYPVWVGIGIAGTALVGATVTGEAVTPLRVVSLALLAAGLAGLTLGARGH